MSIKANLPPITIIIEWENAIDIDDEWTARAMVALCREIERVADQVSEKPRVTYLYDEKAVDPAVIKRMMASVAPRFEEFAELEMVPTPGLTYYKLKNYGVARSRTDLTAMVDSDAAPQPGWLENLLKPFADPSIMAVGGFTVLGHNNFLSKMMALSWIFDLPDERDQTVRRRKIHVNNCAVRTDFFCRNPFPDLPVFKKQCGFWLREIEARGNRYVRTADAMTIHAPQPGFRFLAWRAWVAGSDRDYQIFQENTRSRPARIVHALAFLLSKTARAWSRIIRRGASVDLPLWQRPFAMAAAFGYYFVVTVSGVASALTRHYDPLPRRGQRQQLSLGRPLSGADLV